MSLMVPEEWDWVFILIAGSNWPKGDEDRIRAVARSMYEAGGQLGVAGDELRATLNDVVNYVGESVGHAFARYGQNLVDRQEYYRSTAHDLAKMAEDFALQVEAAKYAILVQLAFAAAEILFIFANPVLMPYYPAFVLAVQRAVQRIMARFIAAVSGLLRYVVRSPAWSDNLARVLTMMLTQAVDEGVDEVREDVIVQVVQFAEGNRHRWDGQSTLNAFRWGAVAGGFSGLLAGVVHVYRPHLAHNPFMSGFNEAATEAFVGGATVSEGGDPSEIWMGALNGALLGAGTQALHNANQGREDRARRNLEARINGPKLDEMPEFDTPGDSSLGANGLSNTNTTATVGTGNGVARSTATLSAGTPATSGGTNGNRLSTAATPPIAVVAVSAPVGPTGAVALSPAEAGLAGTTTTSGADATVLTPGSTSTSGTGTSAATAPSPAGAGGGTAAGATGSAGGQGQSTVASTSTDNPVGRRPQNDNGSSNWQTSAALRDSTAPSAPTSTSAPASTTTGAVLAPTGTVISPGVAPQGQTPAGTGPSAASTGTATSTSAVTGATAPVQASAGADVSTANSPGAGSSVNTTVSKVETAGGRQEGHLTSKTDLPKTSVSAPSGITIQGGAGVGIVPNRGFAPMSASATDTGVNRPNATPESYGRPGVDPSLSARTASAPAQQFLGAGVHSDLHHSGLASPFGVREDNVDEAETGSPDAGDVVGIDVAVGVDTTPARDTAPETSVPLHANTRKPGRGRFAQKAEPQAGENTGGRKKGERESPLLRAEALLMRAGSQPVLVPASTAPLRDKTTRKRERLRMLVAHVLYQAVNQDKDMGDVVTMIDEFVRSRAHSWTSGPLGLMNSNQVLSARSGPIPVEDVSSTRSVMLPATIEDAMSALALEESALHAIWLLADRDRASSFQDWFDSADLVTTTVLTPASTVRERGRDSLEIRSPWTGELVDEVLFVAIEPETTRIAERLHDAVDLGSYTSVVFLADQPVPTSVVDGFWASVHDDYPNLAIHDATRPVNLDEDRDGKFLSVTNGGTWRTRRREDVRPTVADALVALESWRGVDQWVRDHYARSSDPLVSAVAVVERAATSVRHSVAATGVLDLVLFREALSAHPYADIMLNTIVADLSSSENRPALQAVVDAKMIDGSLLDIALPRDISMVFRTMAEPILVAGYRITAAKWTSDVVLQYEVVGHSNKKPRRFAAHAATHRLVLGDDGEVVGIVFLADLQEEHDAVSWIERAGPQRETMLVRSWPVKDRRAEAIAVRPPWRGVPGKTLVVVAHANSDAFEIEVYGERTNFDGKNFADLVIGLVDLGRHSSIALFACETSGPSNQTTTAELFWQKVRTRHPSLVVHGATARMFIAPAGARSFAGYAGPLHGIAEGGIWNTFGDTPPIEDMLADILVTLKDWAEKSLETREFYVSRYPHFAFVQRVHELVGLARSGLATTGSLDLEVLWGYAGSGPLPQLFIGAALWHLASTPDRPDLTGVVDRVDGDSWMSDQIIGWAELVRVAAAEETNGTRVLNAEWAVSPVQTGQDAVVSMSAEFSNGVMLFAGPGTPDMASMSPIPTRRARSAASVLLLGRDGSREAEVEVERLRRLLGATLPSDVESAAVDKLWSHDPTVGPSEDRTVRSRLYEPLVAHSPMEPRSVERNSESIVDEEDLEAVVAPDDSGHPLAVRTPTGAAISPDLVANVYGNATAARARLDALSEIDRHVYLAVAHDIVARHHLPPSTDLYTAGDRGYERMIGGLVRSAAAIAAVHGDLSTADSSAAALFSSTMADELGTRTSDPVPVTALRLPETADFDLVFRRRAEVVPPNVVSGRSKVKDTGPDDQFPQTSEEAWTNYRGAYYDLVHAYGLSEVVVGSIDTVIAPTEATFAFRTANEKVPIREGMVLARANFRKADQDARAWGFDPTSSVTVERALRSEATNRNLVFGVGSAELSPSKPFDDAVAADGRQRTRRGSPVAVRETSPMTFAVGGTTSDGVHGLPPMPQPAQPTLIHGIDRKGVEWTFPPHLISEFGVQDHDGDLVGVSFVLAGKSLVDRVVQFGRDGTTTLTPVSSTEWMRLSAREKRERSIEVPSPWADERGGTFFVDFHSNAEYASLHVAPNHSAEGDHLPPPETVLGVDGAQCAALLVASPVYRATLAECSSVTLLGCLSAGSEHGFAAAFTVEIRKHFPWLDVHAPIADLTVSVDTTSPPLRDEHTGLAVHDGACWWSTSHAAQRLDAVSVDDVLAQLRRWIELSDVERNRYTSADPFAAVIDNTYSVYLRFADDLRRHDGVVDFTAVEFQVESTLRPDLVWTAAVTLLRRNIDLPPVSGVIDHRWDWAVGRMSPVRLPRSVRRMLVLTGEAELIVPGTPVSPARWADATPDGLPAFSGTALVASIEDDVTPSAETVGFVGRDAYGEPVELTADELADPRRRQAVLADESWYRSTTKNAWWVGKPRSLPVAELDAARPRTAVTTVRGETGGVYADSTFGAGRNSDGRPTGTLRGWRSLIAYDVARVEPLPGVWVKEFTVRMHVIRPESVSDRETAALWKRLQRGVERKYNTGWTLPSGDLLRVRVVHTDDPDDAHQTVHVRAADSELGTDQLHYRVDASEEALAHEVGHTLGHDDRNPEEGANARVLQTAPARFRRDRQGGAAVGDAAPAPRNRVLDSASLFGARAGEPDSRLMPHDLWLMEKRLEQLGSVVDTRYAPAPTMQSARPEPTTFVQGAATEDIAFGLPSMPGGPTSSYYGTDWKGATHYFSPADVVVAPIHDHRGEVVGTSYHSPEETEFHQHWFTNSEGERESGLVAGSDFVGFIKPNQFLPVEVPWSRHRGGRNFFVFAHGYEPGPDDMTIDSVGKTAVVNLRSGDILFISGDVLAELVLHTGWLGVTGRFDASTLIVCDAARVNGPGGVSYDFWERVNTRYRGMVVNAATTTIWSRYNRFRSTPRMLLLDGGRWITHGGAAFDVNPTLADVLDQLADWPGKDPSVRAAFVHIPLFSVVDRAVRAGDALRAALDATGTLDFHSIRHLVEAGPAPDLVWSAAIRQAARRPGMPGLWRVFLGPGTGTPIRLPADVLATFHTRGWKGTGTSARWVLAAGVPVPEVSIAARVAVVSVQLARGLRVDGRLDLAAVRGTIEGDAGAADVLRRVGRELHARYGVELTRMRSVAFGTPPVVLPPDVRAMLVLGAPDHDGTRTAQWTTLVADFETPTGDVARIADRLAAEVADSGRLDLAAVSSAVFRTGRPDQVWAAVLARLAARPEAGLVREVVDRHQSDGTWIAVPLPASARSRFTVTGKGVWRAGFVTRPARMVPIGRVEPLVTPDAEFAPPTVEIVIAQGRPGRGDVVPSGALNRFTRWLAETAVELDADDIALPSVEIVGEGHGKMSGDSRSSGISAGRRRAESARQYLVDQLEHVLDEITLPGHEMHVRTILPEHLLPAGQPVSGRYNPNRYEAPKVVLRGQVNLTAPAARDLTPESLHGVASGHPAEEEQGMVYRGVSTADWYTAAIPDFSGQLGNHGRTSLGVGSEQDADLPARAPRSAVQDSDPSSEAAARVRDIVAMWHVEPDPEAVNPLRRKLFHDVVRLVDDRLRQDGTASAAEAARELYELFGDLTGHEWLGTEPLDRVVGKTVRDRSGAIVGVSFTTGADTRVVERWAEDGTRGETLLTDQVLDRDRTNPYPTADRSLVVPIPSRHERTFHVDVHGGPTEVVVPVVTRGVVRHARISPGELARLMLASEAFRTVGGGNLDSITMFACSTGAVEGPGGAAHDFWTAVRETYPNLVVHAPSTRLWLDAELAPSTAIEDGGKWITFGRSANEEPTTADVVGGLRAGWHTRSSQLRAHYAATSSLLGLVDRASRLHTALEGDLIDDGVLDFTAIVDDGPRADLVWEAAITYLRGSAHADRLTGAIGVEHLPVAAKALLEDWGTVGSRAAALPGPAPSASPTAVAGTKVAEGNVRAPRPALAASVLPVWTPSGVEIDPAAVQAIANYLPPATAIIDSLTVAERQPYLARAAAIVHAIHRLPLVNSPDPRHQRYAELIEWIAVVVAASLRATGTTPENEWSSAAVQFAEKMADRLGNRAPAGPVSPATEAWTDVRIAYAEAAMQYERRLAEHIASRPDVNAELAKIVRMVWDDYPPDKRRRLTAGNPSQVGSVLRTTGHVRAVVESGNLRERMALLIRRALDPIPGDQQIPRVPQIKALRGSRRQAEAYTQLKALRGSRRQAEVNTQLKEIDKDEALSDAQKDSLFAELTHQLRRRLPAADVRPPLSAAERELAVDENGRLNWIFGHDIKSVILDGEIHRRAQNSGALVWTGPSGSSHAVMTFVRRMADQNGVKVNLELLRLALIASFLIDGGHRMPEVEEGVELAEPLLQHYTRNLGRYRDIPPLSEDVLREEVAVNGEFPDEIAIRKTARRAPVPSEKTPPAPPHPFDSTLLGELAHDLAVADSTTRDDRELHPHERVIARVELSEKHGARTPTRPLREHVEFTSPSTASDFIVAVDPLLRMHARSLYRHMVVQAGGRSPFSPVAIRIGGPSDETGRNRAEQVRTRLLTHLAEEHRFYRLTGEPNYTLPTADDLLVEFDSLMPMAGSPETTVAINLLDFEDDSLPEATWSASQPIAGASLGSWTPRFTLAFRVVEELPDKADLLRRAYGIVVKHLEPPEEVMSESDVADVKAALKIFNGIVWVVAHQLHLDRTAPEPDRDAIQLALVLALVVGPLTEHTQDDEPQFPEEPDREVTHAGGTRVADVFDADDEFDADGLLSARSPQGSRLAPLGLRALDDTLLPARARLSGLPASMREDVLLRASSIVAEMHQPPRTEPDTSEERAYAQVYRSVVHVVADHLLTGDAPADEYVDLLATQLGNKRTTSSTPSDGDTRGGRPDPGRNRLNGEPLLSEVERTSLWGRDFSFVGLAFPDDIGDSRRARRWALRTAERPVRTYTRLNDDGTTDLREAPWEVDSPNREPLFLHLRSTSKAFTLWSGSHTRQVDGRVIARTVLDGEFGPILRTAPDRPVVLVANDAGRLDEPGGAAHDFADELVSLGHRGTVYAPTRSVTAVPASADLAVHDSGEFVRFGPPVGPVNGEVDTLERPPEDEEDRNDSHPVDEDIGRGLDHFVRSEDDSDETQGTTAPAPTPVPPQQFGGTDVDGHHQTFLLEDLRITPMTGSDGQLIGVSFHKAADQPHRTAWLAQATESDMTALTDQVYERDKKNTTQWRQETLLIPAPWSRGRSNFVLAHGVVMDTGVRAVVNTTAGQKIYVDGTTLANLVLHWNRFTESGQFTLVVCRAGDGLSTDFWHAIRTRFPQGVVNASTSPISTWRGSNSLGVPTLVHSGGFWVTHGGDPVGSNPTVEQVLDQLPGWASKNEALFAHYSSMPLYSVAQRAFDAYQVLAGQLPSGTLDFTTVWPVVDAGPHPDVALRAALEFLATRPALPAVTALVLGDRPPPAGLLAQLREVFEFAMTATTHGHISATWTMSSLPGGVEVPAASLRGRVDRVHRSLRRELALGGLLTLSALRAVVDGDAATATVWRLGFERLMAVPREIPLHGVNFGTPPVDLPPDVLALITVTGVEQVRPSGRRITPAQWSVTAPVTTPTALRRAQWMRQALGTSSRP